MSKKNKSFKRNVSPQIPERCRVGFQRYTVVSGDTMNGIAKRFNVSLEFLIAENPHISNPDKIYPGDVLCVPAQPQPGEGRVPEDCPEGYDRYTVKKGDTVSNIAKQIGVPIDLIIANNPHIPDPSIIFPGDVLCIPIPLKFPCCTILNSVNDGLQDTFGSALVQRLKSSQHLLVITGIYLPDPKNLGNFNMYDGFVGIPGIGGYGFGLTPIAYKADTWIGQIIIPPLLSAGNQIYIIPVNSAAGISGRPILSGKL